MLLLTLATVVAGIESARSAEAVAAVAANFAEPAERLASLFTAETGHALTLSSGSTGTLYAQIVQGAPFDLLLAADAERPELLETAGLAVKGSRLTYAFGRLTLWSPDPTRIGKDGRQVLRKAAFRHLAIANPDLAPYGRAARQALEHFGLWEALEPKLVMGQNIGQTFAMAATGNAELALAAASHVTSARNRSRGSHWQVPVSAHEPIRQQAVLLQRGKDNAAATGFLAFLRTPQARETITAYGYEVE